MVLVVNSGREIKFLQNQIKLHRSTRIRRRRPCHTVTRHLSDYCLNTTIHGLRYVGLKELSIKERLFFGFAFVLVVGLASYFISNIYVKWKQNPMIIGMNAKLSSSRDYPFPAVTICNMNQARESMVKNISTKKWVVNEGGREFSEKVISEIQFQKYAGIFGVE